MIRSMLASKLYHGVQLVVVQISNPMAKLIKDIVERNEAVVMMCIEHIPFGRHTLGRVKWPVTSVICQEDLHFVRIYF